MYKNCPIVIQDKEFSTDLIALPFREFDLFWEWIGYLNTEL